MGASPPEIPTGLDTFRRNCSVGHLNFWSTSYVEFEGKEGAQEYFSQVGTQNLVNKGALEYFGRLVT